MCLVAFSLMPFLLIFFLLFYCNIIRSKKAACWMTSNLIFCFVETFCIGKLKWKSSSFHNASVFIYLIYISKARVNRIMIRRKWGIKTITKTAFHSIKPQWTHRYIENGYLNWAGFCVPYICLAFQLKIRIVHEGKIITVWIIELEIINCYLSPPFFWRIIFCSVNLYIKHLQMISFTHFPPQYFSLTFMDPCPMFFFCRLCIVPT